MLHVKTGWIASTHKRSITTLPHCAPANQTVDTNGRLGYCLDVVDLFMAKAAADRDKDRVFCMALIQHGYVLPGTAISRVNDMPIERAAQGRLRACIKRWTKALRDQGGGLSHARLSAGACMRLRVRMQSQKNSSEEQNVVFPTCQPDCFREIANLLKKNPYGRKHPGKSRMTGRTLHEGICHASPLCD